MSTRPPGGRRPSQEQRPVAFRVDDLLPPTADFVGQPILPNPDPGEQEDARHRLPPAVPTAAPSAVPADPPQPTASTDAHAEPVGGRRQVWQTPVSGTVLAGDDRLRPLATPPAERTLDSLSRWLRATPPWLVSLLFHVALLIVLAVCILPAQVENFFEIQVTTRPDSEAPVLDPALVVPALASTSSPNELARDSVAAAESIDSLPIFDVRLQPFAAAKPASSVSIRRALSGREAAAKRALLAAYGGTAETEDAVRLGLGWLRRNQRRDGTWSLAGPYSNGAPLENKTAATAMAMLAFLGAGHTHRAGEHQDRVTRGARALIKMQDAEGNFYHSMVDHHRLYSQAMATIAVCELYGMTQDEKFRPAAQLALDYAANIQAHDDQAGGWRYIPGQDIDTSVTGWFAMALQSGKMAGLEISEPALQRISIYLDQVTDDGIHYKYRSTHPTSLTMTAEALLCRQYLGWDQGDARLVDGVRYLLTHPIEWRARRRSVYYWYYATQVLHHYGGDSWDDWNNGLKRILPRHQETDGRDRGSWDPVGDEHGGQGGRLYATCLSICMLEVYYRHLPIYAQQ